MYKQYCQRLAIAALLAVGLPAAAHGQNPPAPPASPPAGQAQEPAAAGLPPYKSQCGNFLGSPAAQPPTGSGAVMLAMEVCFDKQPNGPVVPVDTYTYYIQVRPLMSAPSAGKWIPYTTAVEQTMRDDFKRLWDQGFLDDLSIEVTDYVFPNGVIGKFATYHLEERERIKTVRYDGTKQIDRTKIEEELRDRMTVIGVDTFLDASKIRRVETVLRDMMREKGFNAGVTHKIEPIPGADKTVNLTFNIDEGPRRKIKSVVIVGNDKFSDKKLAAQLKDNKVTGLLGVITGAGTVNQTKFEDDAERIEDYYQNRGYPNVRVGTPEIRILEHSDNAKTEWVELRIPVTEGNLYRFGDLDFDGNKRIRTEYLRSLYDVKPGEIYNRKKIVDGNKKAQEAYGSLGFMEFTPYPDLQRSDDTVNPAEAALDETVPAALAPTRTSPAKPETGAVGEVSDQIGKELPKVDVTVRITEGEQFFINRITITGNNTTRDSVVRREMGRLLEGAPFDTEALKFTVRRVNQLGYFKPLEGNEKDLKVEKTPGKPNMVDVTVKLEEQNRNQLTFGAGVSQYEGFFGQLAFQTSNFLGRGETFSVSAQGGERAKNFQVGFTEPYLFDKNITGGVDLHKRELQYVGYYTQKTTGGSVMFGVPLGAFTRAFASYSYERVGISDLSEALIDTSCITSATGCSTITSLKDLSSLTPTQIEILKRNPFVYDSLLVGQGGDRTISKVSPSIVHNTVDHPIFPTIGRKYTAAIDLAVLGGNTQYTKPHLEGIWYFRQSRRTSLGLRGQFEYIAPVHGGPETIPVFERLFLGGEYSVRGFDIRSIGPTVPGSLVVLGGNKSLLFNAEYLISIAGPVRLVLFYDAGQVRDFGESFSWKQQLIKVVPPTPPLFVGDLTQLVPDPSQSVTTTIPVGQTSAFKTSTGVELRFFMPVLNVPFRLIYAWNPQREGVLDNNLQPAKGSVFRFAVGTTF
jgi:outer membrane protein insertion porin family